MLLHRSVVAFQPGGTTVVESYSSTISGPSVFSPDSDWRLMIGTLAQPRLGPKYTSRWVASEPLDDRGVRVNAVAPTWVRTPLTQHLFDDPDNLRMMNATVPLGRPAEVEDLMGAMLYLASEASAMVTGDILLVDGGWLAR